MKKKNNKTGRNDKNARWSSLTDNYCSSCISRFSTWKPKAAEQTKKNNLLNDGMVDPNIEGLSNSPFAAIRPH